MREALKQSDYSTGTHRLREILRAIPVADLPAAYLELKKLSQTEAWRVGEALGARWAESDPRSAAEFALRTEAAPDFIGRNPLLDGVISKWAETSPTAAIAWVEAAPPGASHNAMVITAVEVMADKNPQLALQMLRRDGTALNRTGNVALNIFSTWAGHDLQAAASGALQLNGKLEQEAVTGVASAWAERDPRAALGWIDTLPKSLARQDLVETVGRAWAEKDPRAELAWARSLSDEASRRAALTSGVRRLATADLGAALNLIQTFPAGEEHDQAIAVAAHGAAETDVRSALELVDKLSAGPVRNDLMQQLCLAWSQSEPRSALDWFIQNAPAGKGDNNLNGMVQAWMGNAPEEATAWAQALPPGDRRDSILSRIVSGFVTSDLDRAQSLFAQLPPSAQGDAAGLIVNAIFQDNPEKASAWAQSLPAGGAQKSAFTILGQQWANNDTTAGAQWLGALPEGQARDAAIGSFTSSAFDRDPAGALAWAQTIGDDRDRANHVEQLVRRWLRSDSSAAKSWLDANTQLTPEAKDRILNGPPTWGYQYRRSPF